MSLVTIAEMVRVIFSLKNIRRAPGDAGKLQKITTIKNETPTYQYVQPNGELSMWPGPMHVVVRFLPWTRMYTLCNNRLNFTVRFLILPSWNVGEYLLGLALNVGLLQGFCYLALLMSSSRRVHVYASNVFFTSLRLISMLWKVCDTEHCLLVTR